MLWWPAASDTSGVEGERLFGRKGFKPEIVFVFVFLSNSVPLLENWVGVSGCELTQEMTLSKQKDSLRPILSLCVSRGGVMQKTRARKLSLLLAFVSGGGEKEEDSFLLAL